MKTAVNTSGVSLKNNRRTKVFLFILVLTSIIWLLIELSKTYTSSVVFKVDYANLPSNKLLQNKPISQLNVAVKAPGFNLLKYKTKQHKLTLNLSNIRKNNSLYSYYLLPNEQLSSLNTQLSGETVIEKVFQDTVFVELGNKVSKKVPINPALDIKYKLGYNLTENLKINPDSIFISGPEKFVDSIKEVTTVPLKLTEVYKNINVELLLEKPVKNSNVNYSTSKVKIKGEVDKFTEGRFTIPVTVINEPEGVKMNTFPNEIEVVYQAGLSNFNKITENNIKIVFDYKQYEKDTLLRYLTPVIKQKSEFISTIKVNPAQVEFLIQK